jgi:hypothetical protein
VHPRSGRPSRSCSERPRRAARAPSDCALHPQRAGHGAPARFAAAQQRAAAHPQPQRGRQGCSRRRTAAPRTAPRTTSCRPLRPARLTRRRVNIPANRRTRRRSSTRAELERDGRADTASPRSQPPRSHRRPNTRSHARKRPARSLPQQSRAPHSDAVTRHCPSAPNTTAPKPPPGGDQKTRQRRPVPRSSIPPPERNRREQDRSTWPS